MIRAMLAALLLAALACAAVACSSSAERDSAKPPDQQGHPPDMNDIASALDAALAGDGSARLRFQYIRGHALSGMTVFEVDAGGTFSLSSNQTVGRKDVRLQGTLTAAQRSALLQALRDAGVLALTSVQRIRADDEVPVIVELSSGEAKHRVVMWHDDASQLPRFRALEERLQAVFDELTGNQIIMGIRQ